MTAEKFLNEINESDRSDSLPAYHRPTRARGTPISRRSVTSVTFGSAEEGGAPQAAGSFLRTHPNTTELLPPARSRAPTSYTKML
jgi:hypothetical protein